MDPLAAETQALYEACQFINSTKLENVIFKVYCLEAITLISYRHAQIHWSTQVLIEKIRKYWYFWPKWKFKYFSININFATHNVAIWTAFVQWDGAIIVNSLPSLKG